MSDQILNDISHRRYNPLRGSWILVSPHRTKRPWQGQQEEPAETTLPGYDPSCYLCPGNPRAQGDRNPRYESTFIFVNDYSAVKEAQAEYKPKENIDPLSQRLLRVSPTTGKCFVITFSPNHNLTLADLSPEQIIPVINTWTALYAAYLFPSSPLTKCPAAISPPATNPSVHIPPKPPGANYRWMQIFENKGAAMGCSNPHPHGQVWTTTGLPEEPALELQHLKQYRAQHSSNLLVDYAHLELSDANATERIIYRNEAFVALCPWWATWPFETMILPLQHRRSLVDLNDSERAHLADAVAEVTRRYDNLFETHFPYSMGLHQAPLSGDDSAAGAKDGATLEEEVEASQLHIHFYPPLLRSASVRKFLVGYEMMAEPQRDITPEQAAARLRNCGGELYRRRGKS